MCLAIYKPAGKTIPKRSLANGYHANWSKECGCGFAYSDGSKLVVVKGILPFEEFYKEYRKVEGAHPLLIHFRMATHRPINRENCHPFTMCDGRFALIHNGVFPIPIKNPSLSDTGNFCESIMEPTIKAGRHTNKQLMEGVMGWNMVCLMDEKGKVTIYNEQNGHWDEGVWYSNYGYTLGVNYYCGED